MSCAFPYLVKKKGTDLYYSVACGRCMNCRVDKRNLWTDRCKYELAKYQCGAFVTLTYDDTHLLKNRVISPVDGIPRSTLDYSDFQHFMSTLRHKLEKVPESPGIQHHFKFLCVGEYGIQSTQRPHFHALFFGLDYVACRKIFKQCWSSGFIKVLPILRGGISYVLKYLDKYETGELRKQHFDNHGLRPPMRNQSLSLGAGLFNLSDEFVGEHGFNYPVRNGTKFRPIPTYWRNKFALGYNTKEPLDRATIIENMKRFELKDFSVKGQISFLKSQASIRHAQLIASAHKYGIPVFDWSLYLNQPYKPFLHRYTSAQLRFLSQELIDRYTEEFIK